MQPEQIRKGFAIMIEKELFEKAEKIQAKDWPGSVYAEDYGYEDGFFEDIEDLKTYCEEEEIDLPQYVWAAHKEDESVCLDFDSFMERECEDFGYYRENFDYNQHLNGVEELRRAFDEFNVKNKNVLFTWNIDFTKAIIL